MYATRPIERRPIMPTTADVTEIEVTMLRQLEAIV
jgi:hypothetical protein